MQNAYGFNLGEIVARKYGNDNSLFRVKGYFLQSILIQKANSKPMYVHFTGLRHVAPEEQYRFISSPKTNDQPIQQKAPDQITTICFENPQIDNEFSGNKPKTITTELGIEKLCIHCEEYYPMDKEFFWSGGKKRKDGSKGFCSVCKGCYDERYKRRKYKKVAA